MSGCLTISIRTAPDDVSAAVEALRIQGTLAGSHTLADKGLVLIVAGFDHDETSQPLSSWGGAERQAAAARVLATLGAAGVHGELAGFGYSRDGSFAKN